MEKVKSERRKRIMVKSLRFRIVLMVGVAISIQFFVLVFNNIYAIQIVRKQTFETNSRMLSLYMNQIDSAFRDIENYWITMRMSADFMEINRYDSGIEYYTAQHRLKVDMENAIPSFGYIEDIFMYFQSTGDCIDAAKGSLSGTERKDIKNRVKELAANEIENWIAGEWTGVQVNGEFYLFRILRVRDTYMGGCIKVSTLIKRLQEEGYGNEDYLSFCLNTGEELGSSLPVGTEGVNLNQSQDYYSIVGKDTKYMLLSAPSSCGDYSLVSMIRDDNILEYLGSVRTLIFILGLCFICFLIVYLLSVRKWLMKPLSNLIEAMRLLGSGNLEVRLAEHVEYEEFSVVNKVFDDMTRQIKRLKVDVYEEKMQRQELQLQYLKLQINPHFYINCLNVIHNLTMMNKNDLVQEMTTHLGNHLRYTLEGNSVGYLSREVDYVKNYLKIQELRFANSLKCHFEVDELTENVLVPPLIIQTFVENTVKYQVVAGEMAELFICIRRYMQQGQQRIRIEIWDTGDGFSEEILDHLNSGLSIIDEEGEHYGIWNVQQRLKLIYKGEEEIFFSNHQETGGARIVISLPYSREVSEWKQEERHVEG